MEETPPEPIARVNLTGLPDSQIFSPSFLYTKQENFVEKKTASTNPIGIMARTDSYPEYSNESGAESDLDDDIQCSYCGLAIPAYIGEELHIKSMHEGGITPSKNYEVENIPEASTSGIIKVEYLEKDIQEVNEAVALLDSSSKADFTKLN